MTDNKFLYKRYVALLTILSCVVLITLSILLFLSSAFNLESADIFSSQDVINNDQTPVAKSHMAIIRSTAETFPTSQPIELTPVLQIDDPKNYKTELCNKLKGHKKLTALNKNNKEVYYDVIHVEDKIYVMPFDLYSSVSFYLDCNKGLIQLEEYTVPLEIKDGVTIPESCKYKERVSLNKDEKGRSFTCTKENKDEISIFLEDNLSFIVIKNNKSEIKIIFP